MQQLSERMKELARQHRVTWTRDEDGEYVIRGRRGACHVFDPYKGGFLGLCLCESSEQVRGRKPPLRRYWKERVKQEHPDWPATQEGDVEACFLFPEDELAEALRYIRARRKRQVSPEEAARLARIGEKSRFASMKILAARRL